MTGTTYQECGNGLISLLQLWKSARALRKILDGRGVSSPQPSFALLPSSNLSVLHIAAIPIVSFPDFLLGASSVAWVACHSSWPLHVAVRRDSLSHTSLAIWLCTVSVLALRSAFCLLVFPFSPAPCLVLCFAPNGSVFAFVVPPPTPLALFLGSVEFYSCCWLAFTHWICRTSLSYVVAQRSLAAAPDPIT